VWRHIEASRDNVRLYGLSLPPNEVRRCVVRVVTECRAVTPTRGCYSVIQYRPDESPSEAARVGVIPFCPAVPYPGAITSDANDRVRRYSDSEGVAPRRLSDATRALAALASLSH